MPCSAVIFGVVFQTSFYHYEIVKTHYLYLLLSELAILPAAQAVAAGSRDPFHFLLDLFFQPNLGL